MHDIRSFVKSLSSTSATAHRRLTLQVAEAYGHYSSDASLRIPPPQKIRAGKAGGLPFDSLTTDLFLGCLPATRVCYGNCFAARAAFESGFQFGTRVANELDKDLFRADLAKLPTGQRYLKNGWNSDASWNWSGALELAKLVRENGRHMIFLTKMFNPIEADIMAGLIDLGVEIRLSISAFDSTGQLEQRLGSLEDYRERGGVAVPQMFTTIFLYPELNARQQAIVDYLVDRDLPAAENSLRITPGSPVLGSIEQSACFHVADTGDLWCGRLYADRLLVPPLTALPPTYTGLQGSSLSDNSPEFVKSLWHEQVPTREQLLAEGDLNKPQQCGVPLKWIQLEPARS